jgi:hypothetical protein
MPCRVADIAVLISLALGVLIAGAWFASRWTTLSISRVEWQEGLAPYHRVESTLEVTRGGLVLMHADERYTTGRVGQTGARWRWTTSAPSTFSAWRDEPRYTLGFGRARPLYKGAGWSETRRVLIVPYGLLIALAGAAPLVRLAARAWRRLRRSQGRCAACGYDLRGTPSGGCPECGAGPQADALRPTD